MQNAPFEIRPIAGALGAEIHGVNLSADFSDDMAAALRQALLDHLVIFFRDQDLPPARLHLSDAGAEYFCRRFSRSDESSLRNGQVDFFEFR